MKGELNVQMNAEGYGPKVIVLLFILVYVAFVKRKNHLQMLGIGIGPIKKLEA
jgi:hypothetical protein